MIDIKIEKCCIRQDKDTILKAIYNPGKKD